MFVIEHHLNVFKTKKLRQATQKGCKKYKAKMCYKNLRNVPSKYCSYEACQMTRAYQIYISKYSKSDGDSDHVHCEGNNGQIT